MRVLVAYSTRYGATLGIAERIAEVLGRHGHQSEARPVWAVDAPAGYDAVLVGSALYFGRWRREATAWVRRHRGALAQRPVWLFSSGPLGTRTTDPDGVDLRESAAPKELPELLAAVRPRDHRVFFGALEVRRLGLRDRIIRSMPAARELLPEGDFRDWPEIEAWAAEVARELAPAAEARGPDLQPAPTPAEVAPPVGPHPELRPR